VRRTVKSKAAADGNLTLLHSKVQNRLHERKKGLALVQGQQPPKAHHIAFLAEYIPKIN
jgi:hypothetical protein